MLSKDKQNELQSQFNAIKISKTAETKYMQFFIKTNRINYDRNSVKVL